MAVRRALAWVLAFALVPGVGLVVGLPLTAAAADTVAFTIDDDRITESSGLARDPDAGGYWTINDSGDDAIAYGLDPTGKVTGTLEYRADPVDVEAVAMHEGRLYVADIGDNGADRDFVTVYFFPDARADGDTVTYRSWEFSYPDGAHDAETLLVDEDGRLSIVTKDADGGVYRAPRAPSRTRVNELDRVGDAPAGVTDGTFLPGGDRIALLTFGRVEVLDAETYAKVGEASVPANPLSESLTVSLDGSSLLVGNEGENSKVYSVPIPGGGDQSPSASPSASSSGTAAPEPEENDPSAEAAEVDASTGQSRARTLLALGIAGLVAILAGCVVVLVRRA